MQDLELSFDVGHSSLGWAVLQSSADVPAAANAPRINILGCGVVTFGADDCLASKRRDYRRQRRHARSTRHRIAQMEKLLAHLKVLSAEELKQKHQQAGGSSVPWLLAARALAASTEDEKNKSLLNWNELWDVLRWYAHNRGYDGNQRWSNREVIRAFNPKGLHQISKPTDDDEKSLVAAAEKADADAGVQNEADSDVKKVKEAFKQMRDYGTLTMAETMASHIAKFEIQAAEHRLGKRTEKPTRFKGLGAAFPRRIIRVINNEQTLAGGVEWEMRYILRAHFGHLPNCDANFERAICGGLPESKFDWRAYEQSHPALYLTSKEEKLKLRELRIPRKADKQTKLEKKKLRAEFLRDKLVLPSPFEGGLLFGQAVPRFDNRIISTCPITGEKVPSKNCPEFFKFRWAMILANIQVAKAGEKELRPLTGDERKKIDAVMREKGALTENELKKLVRETTNSTRDKLDQMLMEEVDAKNALIVDPIQKLVRSDKLKSLWPAFSPRVQKRVRDLWQRGKLVTLERICDIAKKLGESLAEFEAELNKLADAANTKRGKKEGSFNREALLREPLTIKKLDGRAAYARPLLVRAYAEVMAGKHPKETGGCLEVTDAMRQAQLQKQIDQQTNNHLVRHRLLILERLLKDLITEPAYANGDKSRIAKVTIEVNRDLREMSGKSAKEIQQDLGRRLANHHSVAAKLEKDLDGKTYNGQPIQITAGLIRKARIAEDLGWTCPYTGQSYDALDLVSRQVDKDHIIPRSLRPADGLDSLVITFSEVNKMKGQRTAVQFVSDEQEKIVDGMPQLSIVSVTRFKKWAEGLETFKGHDDDQRRKKKRKELLLLQSYEEKGFVPRDLTVTSQLVRLGAQNIRKTLPDLNPSKVVSLPGSVTGTVRKGWNLLGCLALAAPQVKEADGSLKTKTDIRSVTHLHHALDACVLGLASHYLPNNGGLWELMLKRNPNEADKAVLRSTGYFDFDSQGRFGLTELPEALKEQIRQRLAEKRVVQHIPADMSGMRVEENTRSAALNGSGKYDLNPPHDKGALPARKLVGLQPKHGNGKLKPQRGVRVITDNFGVAILDYNPEKRFQIIPWFKVWPRIYKGIGEEKSLVEQNDGKPPRILRNGMLIRIGKFRVLKPTRILENSLWMVDSIGDFDGVIKADLKPCDVVNTRFEGLDPTDPTGKKKKKFTAAGCKLSTDLERVYEGVLEILDNPLTGVPALPLENSSAGCTAQKDRYPTKNEIAIRPAGSTDGGGHSPGGGGLGSPLQTRAKFLKNWDWHAVVSINRGACERSRAQHGVNSETGTACAAEWEALRSESLTLDKTFERLRGFHRKAPFLFFNGNTFATIGRELSFALFSDLAPGRKREIGSAIAHHIAGVLDHDMMTQIVESLCQTAAFQAGDRVKTMRGSLHGQVIRLLGDGRLVWRADDAGNELISLPESLVPEE